MVVQFSQLSDWDIKSCLESWRQISEKCDNALGFPAAITDTKVLRSALGISLWSGVFGQIVLVP